MKTIEFKLEPTKRQLSLLEEWLPQLSIVWNRGLALLEWRQYYLRLQDCLAVPDTWGFITTNADIYCHYDEKKKTFGLACSIVHQRRIDKTKGWEVVGNVEAHWSVRLVKAHWLEEPPISHWSYNSLRKPFTRRDWKDERITLPQIWVNELIVELAAAWEKYQKGKAQKPRFKRPNERLTFKARKSGNYGEHSGNYVKLPTLLNTKVQGLSKRIRPDQAICSYNICKKATGWYFQAVVDTSKNSTQAESETEQQAPVPETGQLVQVELNPNQPSVLYKTERWEIPSLPVDEKLEKKLKRLQRRLAKCQPGSLNFHKYKNQIGKIHERLSRRRRAYQHMHSTILARITGGRIELTTRKPLPKTRPDPVLDSDGKTYLPNGASKQAERNRETANAAVGQFKTLLLNKVKTVIETPCEDRNQEEATLVQQRNATPVEPRPLNQTDLQAVHLTDIPENDLTIQQPKVSVRKRPISVHTQPVRPEDKPGVGPTPNYPKVKTNRRMHKLNKALQQQIEDNA